jgi:hypothetical protein
MNSATSTTIQHYTNTLYVIPYNFIYFTCEMDVQIPKSSICLPWDVLGDCRDRNAVDIK